MYQCIFMWGLKGWYNALQGNRLPDCILLYRCKLPMGCCPLLRPHQKVSFWARISTANTKHHIFIYSQNYKHHFQHAHALLHLGNIYCLNFAAKQHRSTGHHHSCITDQGLKKRANDFIQLNVRLSARFSLCLHFYLASSFKTRPLIRIISSGINRTRRAIRAVRKTRSTRATRRTEAPPVIPGSLRMEISRGVVNL